MNFAILAVYPAEGVTQSVKKDRKRPDLTGGIEWDLVTIPYQQFARILITPQEPGDEKTAMGFHVIAR